MMVRSFLIQRKTTPIIFTIFSNGNFPLNPALGQSILSFLPIGSYEPQYFMKIDHMNPEEALLAHKDLESNFSLGMHFGTFQLTDEPINEPVERLKKTGVTNFEVLDHGESKKF